jgi:hypothetical protein
MAKEKKGFETLDEAQEFANKKAEELTNKFGKKVHPMIFIQDEDSTDYAIGYLKEPNRMDKIQAMDVAFSSPMKAGMRILEMGLIKEESDYRFLNDDSAYDAINIGAYQKALTIVQFASDLAKKKEK